MSIIHIESGRYPLTQGEVMAENRGISFTIPFEPSAGYAWVVDAPPPAFDAATHKIVGLSPVQSQGKWQRAWKVVALTQAELAERTAATAALLTAARNTAVLRIDTDVDAIYGDVMGNRAAEYAEAEHQGLEFKSAGYAGPVPSMVQSWATAKGWPAKQACDDIVATAAAWRGAQAAIRSHRLQRKEQAKAAPDAAALAAVMQQWAGFLAVVRTQLGL